MHLVAWRSCPSAQNNDADCHMHLRTKVNIKILQPPAKYCDAEQN